MNTQEITFAIKEEGYRLGFDMVGVSRAEFLEKEARNLEEWLNQQKHGQMSWMENHFDKRLDPRLLVPGAKSVISVIHNYLPQEHWQPPQDAPKISTYAWGEDYHKVLKKKLYELFRFIGEKIGTEVPGRVFVDSAPVLEKTWAKRSGLGWIGKNTNLITPRKGSWFFIGEIILDLDLIYDGAVKDYCGTCTRCIDACPTEALEPYKIDATRCISYLTIELRENIEDSFSGQMGGWAYGCDICQEVCPWNRFATPHPGNEFKPLSFILDFGPRDWEELDEKTFKKLTRFSAMSRIKWQKMEDNLAKAGGKKFPPA